MKKTFSLIVILICLCGCSYNNEIIFSVSAMKSKSSNNEDGYSFQIPKNNFEISEDEEKSVIKKLKNSSLIDSQGKTYDFIAGVLDDNYKIYSVAEVSYKADRMGWKVILVICNVYNELINIYELAVWDPDTDTICTGNITSDLILNKICGSNEELTISKISGRHIIEL